MEEFFKLCPKCGDKQIYSCKSVLILSVKKNRICNSCRSKNKRTNQIEILEKNCPQCGNIQKYGSRKIFNRAFKGKWLCKKCATGKSANKIDRSFQRTAEYRQMMSKLCTGRKHSEKTKEKLRNYKLEQIEQKGTKINFNSNACEFIHEFGKKYGYNFQHALNGGEVVVYGYSLDGYDKEKNIVFEYDEPKHNILSVKSKDKIREKRIIEKFNPNMFIRYNEQFKKFHDVISGKEWI